MKLKSKKCKVYLCADGHQSRANIAEHWFFVNGQHVPVFTDYALDKPDASAVPCCEMCRMEIRMRINV